jgi:hypothetical protein
MREHLTELLPLLLVGLVLLVFELTRANGLVARFLPVADVIAAPTPTIAVPAVAPSRTRTPLAKRTPAAVSCSPARPSFVGGIAELREHLGASIGDALECERAVDDHGNTQQNTTTGLAYYRSQQNVACFTTGWDHWGLRAGIVVHWTGDDIEPPLEAVPIAP